MFFVHRVLINVRRIAVTAYYRFVYRDRLYMDSILNSEEILTCILNLQVVLNLAIIVL